jgi:nucleolar protein 6
VKPKSVRHLTQKDDPSKSKGCAFVEFDGYDHMKTALRLFHHSNFEDGQSPPRKINVELTYVSFTFSHLTYLSPFITTYCSCRAPLLSSNLHPLCIATNAQPSAGGGGNTKDRRSKIQQKNAKLNDERARRMQEEEKAKWEKKKEAAGDDSGIHPSRRARVPGGR